MLTIVRQETPRSYSASFAALQHPVLPSQFALLLMRNVQGTQCCVFWRAPGLPFGFCTHPRQVFPSFGIHTKSTQHNCLLQSLPDYFAFKFLFCLVYAGTGVKGMELGMALCSTAAPLVF